MRWARMLLSGRVAAASRWTLGAAIFNTVAGILTARLLLPDDRGVLAVLLTVSGLATVLGSLGTNVVVRSDYPRYGGGLLRTYAGLSVRLLCVVASPLALVALVAVNSSISADVLRPQVLAVFSGYLIVNFGWFQLQEGLAAVGRIVSVARISAAGSAALAGLLIMGYLSGLGMVGIGWCYVISMAVQSGMAALKLRHYVGKEGSVGYSLLLREGSRALGYHAGQNLTFRIDRYLVASLGSDYYAGLYAVAATPAELVRLPITAAGQFSMLDTARSAPTFSAVAVRAGMVTCFAAVVGGAGALAAPFLIPLVYGAAYADAVGVFVVLAAAQVFLAPYLIFSRVLAGLGARWRSSAVGCSGVIVMLGVSVATIPPLGAQGAGIAAAASYAVMSIASIGFCWGALNPDSAKSAAAV